MSAPHRPGQAPWPESGRPYQGEPVGPSGDRPPPIQFHNERPKDADNPVVVWLLRGLGLLAVAVLSGAVWWYVNSESPRPPGGSDASQQRQAGGQYTFTPVEQVPEPRRDSTCAEHAYGKVQQFFRATPCQQLTRATYTTSAADGRKVYTNVSVVRMPSDQDAAKLRELTDTDGTGNVNDLVREGVVKIGSLKWLSDGYHAVQHGQDVIIIESAFDPGATNGEDKADERILDDICADAVRLGDDIKS